MPLLADPSDIRSRPASVALGELAIAAGIVGESVTIVSDFPANVLCPIWRHHAQSLGAGSVVHAKTKKDIKALLEGHVSGTRAVFLYSPRLYHDVAWSIQMAASDTMSPKPAVFCGFQHDDTDADPGLTLSLTGDQREIAAVLSWSSDEYDRRVVEVDHLSSVDYDPRLAEALHPSAFEHHGIGHREVRITGALVEGAALLRTAAQQADGDLQITLGDYDFIRGLLCSSCVKPNRDLCDPLTVAMVNRANAYLAVKLGNDRWNPFRVQDDDGYRRSRAGSQKRDSITRRELADLGNPNSRLLVTLVEYLQHANAGNAHSLQLGCNGRPIQERDWGRLSARELVERLTTWSVKQVRTYFDRLLKRGLVTARREQANGPIRYEIPEELTNVQSPFTALPTARSLTRE